jgi:hypothetical protein
MNPQQFQIYTDSIAYTLSTDMAAGDEFKYILKLGNGTYFFMDTVTKYFGPKLIAFEDNCNQFTNWTSPKWNVTNASYHSPTGSITDSPSGNYSNNTSVAVTMYNKIDLKDSPVAVIDFWGKWDTERGFDYVQALVSTDNGSHYTPQQGRYTRIGSANEVPGSPVFDGRQASWVNEEIVLTGTSNKDLLFRFNLTSDASKNADGYYFDDFSVSIIDMSGVGIDERAKSPLFLSNPVPNPASSAVQIKYRFPGNQAAELILLDSKGIQVKNISLPENSGTISLSVDNLKSGIYFYRIGGSFGTSEVKKLVVIR